MKKKTSGKLSGYHSENSNVPVIAGQLAPIKQSSGQKVKKDKLADLQKESMNYNGMRPASPILEKPLRKKKGKRIAAAKEIIVPEIINSNSLQNVD